MSRRCVCPDCGRRGVYLRMSAGGDVWSCRYERQYGCTFFAYDKGYDPEDVKQRGRLRAANPDNALVPRG